MPETHGHPEFGVKCCILCLIVSVTLYEFYFIRSWFEIQENEYASELIRAMKDAEEKQRLRELRNKRKTRTKRWLKVGAAALVGGGLLVVTGESELLSDLTHTLFLVFHRTHT